MEEEKSPQEQVKEAIWTYTGWAVIILACIGAGVFIGYEAWGDAPTLRRKVDQYEKQVLELKNNRESLQTQIAMATRDRDECQKSLESTGLKPLSPGGSAPAQE